MIVDHKAIISRLSAACRTALEAALGQCMNARHYEATVEHVLIALLDNAESDVAFLVNHYDLDPARLRQALQRGLDDLRTGNAGRPQFSPVLLDWMQDAWTVGSMDYNYGKIRSGVLFLLLARSPAKYATSSIGNYLEGISKEDLKVNLSKIISDSKEQGESLGGAGGGAGAGGAGGKDLGGKGSVAPDSALGKFCVDYTGRARAGLIDPIFGREPEIRQIIDILARRRKNNPIIVGDSGVGKTALVDGLALMIVNNQVPPLLQNTDIMGLDLGLLQAGASVKG